MVPGENLIGNSSGNHCLGKPGSEYLVYFVNGGSLALSIAQVSGQISGAWMNAYTGQQQNAGPYGNGAQPLTAPWANVPSVLWLHTGQTAIASRADKHDVRQDVTGPFPGKCRLDIVNLQGRVIASFDIYGSDMNDWGKACIKRHICPGVYYAKVHPNNNNGRYSFQKITVSLMEE
jgi:hypothetical protein